MDDARHAGRLKSINLTKLQESYKRYLRVVPRDSRASSLSDSWHPSTPDHRADLSHSLWNKRLSRWRRLVHAWDSVRDSDCEALSRSLSSGDLASFVSVCDGRRCAPAALDVPRDLLGEHSAERFYPVLFKPSWFRGPISHAGFQTVGEAEFLRASGALLSDLDAAFAQKLLASYSARRPD